MVTLRPYQEEARQAVLNEWSQGRKRTLLVLPTGCGKTIVFSSIVQHQVENGGRVLIMAHRSELLDQAADKLQRVCGIPSALEKAESTSLGSFFPVTVGSVQTLCRESRLQRFSPEYFTDIVVDEAHHCMSDSYQRVLGHFPNANVLGVTATPDRSDQKSLGQFFDSKAYEYSMRKAVQEGYLSPIKAQMIPLKVDISNVGISNGDYAADGLGEALDPYLEQIADEMDRYCRGRRTVVFLPLVATSQKFRDILVEKGFRAAEVNGNSEDRAEILADFEAGKYDVITNACLLTEGWDCPAVDCVIVLRPTKSRSLYCLDEKTEVLTEHGWARDVQCGENVAAFDRETGEIRFVPALATVRRPLEADEHFVSIKGPSVDIRVTNKHRMLYRNRRSNSGWQFTTAEHIAELKDGCQIPAAGHSAFPGVPLTDDEIRFIGWVMTDGTINRKNNAIAISQSSHQPWLEEIQKCIDGCGFKHRRFIAKRNTQFHENGENVIWTISKGKPRGRDKDKRGWGDLEDFLSKDISPTQGTSPSLMADDRQPPQRLRALFLWRRNDPIQANAIHG